MFSAVKLTDYWERWEELERNENPFAVVVQAHLIALETRGDARERLRRKLEITKRLYERGFNETQIIGLFRFIDWGLTLPIELDDEFERKLSEYEEEKKMQYVTSVERIRIQRGIEKGMQMASAAIALRMLQKRFGPLDQALQAHICALPFEQLEELSEALLDFNALSDLEAWLQQHPLPSATSSVSEKVNGVALEP